MCNAEEDIKKQCEAKETNIVFSEDEKISDIIRYHYPHLSIKELGICRQVIFTMNYFGSVVSPAEEVIARESLYKRVYASESEISTLLESLIKKRVLIKYEIITYQGRERISKSILTFVNRDMLMELLFYSSPY